jgi:hypothetical protein
MEEEAVNELTLEIAVFKDMSFDSVLIEHITKEDIRET